MSEKITVSATVAHDDAIAVSRKALQLLADDTLEAAHMTNDNGPISKAQRVIREMLAAAPAASEQEPAFDAVACVQAAQFEVGSRFAELPEWFIDIWQRRIAYIIEAGSTITPTEERRSETAWLVESVAGRWGTGFYLTGVGDYDSWGTIEKAIRFARKEDAERVIESLHERDARAGRTMAGNKQVYEACEHEWPSPHMNKGDANA